MTNIFVKPAPVQDGAGFVLVRDPATMIPLAEEGEWKAKSSFWVRRLRDGDVIAATQAVAAEIAKPAPSALPAGVFTACAACVSPLACETDARCKAAV